uniref:Transposase n=1 Tax=Acrobeloides nanus TaxID=290746 RepID=A0A914E1U2_9BILA
MIWAGICATGKTPLVFVDPGVKINRHVYMDMLAEHCFPWAEQHFGNDWWCFQQDGCPGHKAYETQDFLRANCPDFIKVDTHWRNADGEWPPSSPDLNPLDYAVWSILEEKASWDEISVETLRKIVDDFPKRLKACVEAEGGHFE